MKFYQIEEQSRLTSTTVRVLRRDDKISFFKSSQRSEVQYRNYYKDFGD